MIVAAGHQNTGLLDAKILHHPEVLPGGPDPGSDLREAQPQSLTAFDGLPVPLAVNEKLRLADQAVRPAQLAQQLEQVGDGFQFVKENTMCTLVSYKGSVFSVEAPNFMELEVTATEPGVRGDTATNVTKPATLETGAIIKVPLFINEGEKIQVDTRTGEYLGRVKE